MFDFLASQANGQPATNVRAYGTLKAGSDGNGKLHQAFGFRIERPRLCGFLS